MSQFHRPQYAEWVTLNRIDMEKLRFNHDLYLLTLEHIAEHCEDEAKTMAQRALRHAL
jgi:hypothetical protein